MKNVTAPILLILIFAAVIVASNAFFIVPETRTAIVLRLGDPTGEYTASGLKMKIPFLEGVEYIDKRNRELDQEEIEIIASDQERLKVDAFARYKIVDPLLFYKSVRTELGGETRLKSLMNQNLRQVLGRVGIDDIVSGERAALMINIRDQLRNGAKEFGIEIIDVKIRQTELPEPGRREMKLLSKFKLKPTGKRQKSGLQQKKSRKKFAVALMQKEMRFLPQPIIKTQSSLLFIGRCKPMKRPY